MAITEPFAGSEAVTQATEWDLPTDTSFVADAQTDDGVYQLWLNLATLVDGDTIAIRGYEKVQAADAQERFFRQDVSNAQTGEKNWVSPSFIFLHGWTFTLQMISATTRTITWSIRKVA